MGVTYPCGSVLVWRTITREIPDMVETLHIINGQKQWGSYCASWQGTLYTLRGHEFSVTPSADILALSFLWSVRRIGRFRVTAGINVNLPLLELASGFDPALRWLCPPSGKYEAFSATLCRHHRMRATR